MVISKTYLDMTIYCWKHWYFAALQGHTRRAGQ